MKGWVGVEYSAMRWFGQKEWREVCEENLEAEMREDLSGGEIVWIRFLKHAHFIEGERPRMLFIYILFSQFCNKLISEGRKNRNFLYFLNVTVLLVKNTIQWSSPGKRRQIDMGCKREEDVLVLE